ncbi:MAG: hypothetical protein A2915_03330 [Candidatus Yanofskybacteria bacterium RIFCSPLOWO2_01_FULL_41_34]|uniref:Glycosyl transferase family 1 domain-containing protein n=1 Tax=Candidatus Yanofskybacteria bacterium RIFCSPHIGHO2_01_FULL_41_26 TaxID=1802661 RepID=A0A1F8EFZ9_9BACT|nr:MAG: hypothetical protein A2649_01225 [Candidatus Yanofskybacteria bacterium RIFCSPHIGHO2_01_FULL_41_26]OGN21063.1 MAG: hypothetical protein A2915_03330 [Candidatus Yanofskybacteria bacterium RIFCSPLOWO2_01_FULL_41_34]
MRILYFGVYNPDYSRNRVLIKGLKQNGTEIVECREEIKSFFKYLKLILKYLKLRRKFDVMIVGFPGQEVMFLARLLTFKPIVFDAFTSHYGGYILDRQYFNKTSWRAKYYRWIDKFSCRLADLVLLDTNAHVNFFVEEFGLPPDKFKRIFVGADEDVFYPRESAKKEDKFLVHFHGYYIPLQGVEYIIRAAKLLEKENIMFNLIGRGQTYEKNRKLAADLDVKNINFIDKMSYFDLTEHVAMADICLGIFGDSPKTDLVIPNKVYEAIAMGKPVITADTPAARELLSDGENVLFCRKADPEDLAEKIRFLKNSSDRSRIIGEGAKTLFNEKLASSILAGELLKHIRES